MPRGPVGRLLELGSNRLYFLKLDAALFVIVATTVLVRIVKLWIERRRGAAGSKLHTRLVLLFGLVAVAPTIIVAVASAVVFTQGVEAWFNNVVRSALNESNAIASAYVEENRRYLRDDILGLANEFSTDSAANIQEPRTNSIGFGSGGGVKRVT